MQVVRAVAARYLWTGSRSIENRKENYRTKILQELESLLLREEFQKNCHNLAGRHVIGKLPINHHGLDGVSESVGKRSSDFNQ